MQTCQYLRAERSCRFAAINHDAGSNVKNIMIKISYEPEEGTVVPEEGVDVSTFAEFEFVQAV